MFASWTVTQIVNTERICRKTFFLGGAMSSKTYWRNRRKPKSSNRKRWLRMRRHLSIKTRFEVKTQRNRFVNWIIVVAIFPTTTALAAPNAPEWVCSELNKVSQNGLAVTVHCSYASSSTEKVDIDWGDGVTDVLPSGSHSFNRSHAYAKGGHYKITLRVWNEEGTGHNDCILEVDLTPDGIPTGSGNAVCKKWDGSVGVDKSHTAQYTFKVVRNGATEFEESGTLAKGQTKTFGNEWNLDTDGNVVSIYYKVVTDDGKKAEATLPFSLDCLTSVGKCLIVSINPPTSKKIEASGIGATVHLGGLAGDAYWLLYKKSASNLT